MDSKQTNLNTNDDDIFAMNIFESNTPETKENLPGANVPKLQETFPGTSISIPQTTEISEDAYNKAIDDLQKSFNEAFDTLKGVRPVPETIDEKQARFTENAIMESYCTGPYFESATRKDKTAIQDAVRSIKDLIKEGKKDPYTLKPISILSYIYGRAVYPRGPQRKWSGISKLNPIVWQMCGVFFCHENEINEALDHYKTKFAKEIGDLTFNSIRCGLTWPDFYGKKAKGADGQAHILLVDTKRDKEIKEFDLPSKEELEAAVAEDKK